MKEVILRQAQISDVPAVRKILGPWAEKDSRLAENLDRLVGGVGPEKIHRTVLETGGTLHAVSLWTGTPSNEARLLAFGVGPRAAELSAGVRLLRDEILQWTEMGLSRVTIELPTALSSSITGCLRTCGFIVEGVSSGCTVGDHARIRLSKYFLYRTMPGNEMIDFLREFMKSLGYEVRGERDGFSYRVKEEFRFPFTFSHWHRLSARGNDIIVHPPARVLPYHELETLFYPLRISSHKERPLLVPMGKQRAERLLDLPQAQPRQKSLFGEGVEGGKRFVRLNDLTYTYPPGKKAVRKGLPLLFYVNRIGAVGAARVEDSYLETAGNLAKKNGGASLGLDEYPKENGPEPIPETRKVRVVRFQWYKPLRKAVTLEEIRAMDRHFNPQRTRTVSSDLFDSVLESGNSSD